MASSRTTCSRKSRPARVDRSQVDALRLGPSQVESPELEPPAADSSHPSALGADPGRTGRRPRGTARRWSAFAVLLPVVGALSAPVRAAERAAWGAPTPDARPVSYLSATKAVLNYETSTPQPTRIQIRVGTLPASTPGQEEAWRDVLILDNDPTPKRRHSVTLSGFEPATRYFYRYWVGDENGDRPGPWSADPPWSREYAFATLGGPGRTSFLRIPVKVLIVPNVINLSTVAPEAPAPTPMPEEEIEQYRVSLRQAALFYWVNSRMRYWIDCEFFVEPEWQRVGEPRPELGEFYRDLRPVRDGLRVFDPGDVANHDPRPPLKDERIWTGQVVIVCERRWDAARRAWVYQLSGGGTFGVDWMLWGDETQRPAPGRSTWLGGSDQAWLMCHEFHHQKESQYAFSGLTTEHDRVVFCHFAPPYRSPFDEQRWATAFNHGEHWDGIAWELRMLTDAQYFRNMFGEIATATDTDGDGIPDHDPRLPLDEKRLGSDATSATTDGVNHDMDKVLMAKWVPSMLTDLRVRRFNPGYAALWALSTGAARPESRPGDAGYRWPEFRTTDSDGDGVPDAEDPYPIYPWKPAIPAAQITVDGDLADWADVPPIGALRWAGDRSDAELVCTLKTAHDDQNLYYAVEIVGAYSSVMFNIDADADGWYVGNDNLQIVVGQPAAENDPGPGRSPDRGVALDPAGAPVLRQVLGHISSQRGWPYWDDGRPLTWTDPRTGRAYTWARPKMYGDWRDVTFRSSAANGRRVFELALPNGAGKLPIQAGPGHPVALAFYIRLADGGALSVYEPYTLFATTWE